MKRPINARLKRQTTEPDFFSTQVYSARRFYRSLKHSHTKDISVISAGCEVCIPGYTIERNGFPYPVVEFLASGQGQLVLPDIDTRILPGAVYAYGPKIRHRITNPNDSAMIKYFIVLNGEKAWRLLTRDIPLMGQILYAANAQTLYVTFEELLQYGLDTNPQYDRICELLAELLLLKISETALPHLEIEKASYATYQRCRAVIAAQYLEFKTLAHISDACGIDPAYLCRLYRKYDQQSPYQHLVRLKMNHAANRLQSEDISIKELAYAMGYDDPFHFSRAFKRVFGISPIRFNKNRGL
jgi:AraC-like DNA-binding protein